MSIELEHFGNYVLLKIILKKKPGEVFTRFREV